MEPQEPPSPLNPPLGRPGDEADGPGTSRGYAHKINTPMLHFDLFRLPVLTTLTPLSQRLWCNLGSIDRDLTQFRRLDIGMAKRTRKVAFIEEVELAEKRRREEELYEHEEKRRCALIGIITVY